MATVRYGRDRSSLDYSEPFRAEKRRLLEQINNERKALGLSELKYDTRAARVGDEFCADSARNFFIGHWDLEGRAPYLRWALGGGVDYHAQNFASQSKIPGPLTESVETLLLSAHARMMAEKPPDDGHRRTVLDPAWTHVGIGAALAGGEFRMTEEFSRQNLEWIEIPARPLPAGMFALFAAKLPSRWNLAFIEVGYEPVPPPLTREQIRKRGGYTYPPSCKRLRVRLSHPRLYKDDTQGEIAVDSSGIFRTAIPLTQGRGNYYIYVFADEGDVFGRPLSPVTSALVRVE